MGFIKKIAKGIFKGVKKIIGVIGKVIGGVFGFLVPKKASGAKAAPPNNLTKQLEPDTSRKIVLGKIASPLDTRYWEVWGPDAKNFDEIIATATHQIHSYQELYIEEKLAINAAGVVQAAFTGVLTRDTRLGASGQTGIVTGGGTQYNAASTFDGCANFKLAWVPNETKLPNGIPSRYTQIVEGALVYDPRRDSTVTGGSGTHRIDDRTTWAYATLDANNQPIGRNNALQALWYLLGWTIPTKDAGGVLTGEQMLVAGRGVDPSDINLATFIAGANACETAAYYTDLTLSTDDDHTANENAITCDGLIGRLIDPGGLWSYYANVDDTANIAVELTDSDILDNSPIEWNEYESLNQQFNQVGGKFVNPLPPTLYQSYPYPLVRDAVYEANLGIKKRRTIDFRQILDNTLAQRLARLALNEAQYQGEFNCNWNYKALRAQAWSIVRYTSERFGWTKLFRVWRHEISSQNGVGMTLREVHPSIWTAGTISPPIAPGDVINADAMAPIAPTGILVSLLTSTAADGVTISDGFKITWDLPSLAVRRTEIRYKQVGAVNWLTGGVVNRDTDNASYFPIYPNTDYAVEIRHISIREVQGPWTGGTFTSGNNSNMTYAEIQAAAGTAIWANITGAGRPEDDATRNVARGPWATATAYVVGDIFTFLGESYIVHTAHNSSGAAPDLTKVYTFAQAGITVDIKFIRSNATPATPVGSNPAGWTNGVPAGSGTLWLSRANKDAAGNIVGLWTTPQSINGVTFLGAYAAGTAYIANQSVTYNGGTYIAIGPTTGNAPSGTANANAYWDVLAAPGATGTPGTPPSAFTQTINLTSGAAVNLRTVADAAGYTGNSNATITFNVPNGVTIRGLAGFPGGYGIDTGVWPTGSYTIALTLVCQSGGIVDGGGGSGGGSSGNGGNGGDAIYLRTPISGGITVNAGGIVRAGGGGGGSGGDRHIISGVDCDIESIVGGGGGGGGFPNGAGGISSGGNNGTAGTTAGGGAAGGATGTAGAGGAGGNAATVGSNGTAATGGAGSCGSNWNDSGGNGGAAGYAVRKNGHAATVTNNGTLTGTAA